MFYLFSISFVLLNRFSDKYGFYDQFDTSNTEALETLADHFDALVDDKEVSESIT